MPTLALVRHGQSLWNLQNRFTGWVDVPLTERGREEARTAGAALRGIGFDVAYTSALRRAQDTLAIILAETGLDVPVIRDAALNERDYGDLAGLDKAETAERYGPEQVHTWRRSFDVAPPGGESLRDTAARTLPFFDRAVMGDLRHGRDVLVVAHGNSNRSIVMRLDDLGPEEVVTVELATGVPVLYDLDDAGRVTGKRVL
jgi:2,3-bisphosphoglycerate-dependent phosphoglycerate mutase